MGTKVRADYLYFGILFGSVLATPYLIFTDLLFIEFGIKNQRVILTICRI